ncbi:MAG: radical SAM protein [Desulfuromonadaceae bacterium]|nr:radical SAM protein [Desulfuromonadaceae bacterium]MDD5104097.1 radical SAM protein [Desulfuromonadaceae bacterium]
MKVMLACANDSPLVASFSEKGGISVPLGLAYLGAFVRDLPGMQVSGFDNNVIKLVPQQYRELFRAEAPDVVGISILTATVHTTWEMARIVKEVLPHAVVVVGGMQCSALPEDTLEEQAIDYGVVGEGEEPFRELLVALQEKRDPTGIPNLVYRREGKVLVNPRRPPIRDLDTIPFPARDLFDIDRYRLNVNRRATSSKSTTILTSRGCPYGCIFCSSSIYGRHFNQRSPQNVIAEMKLLEQQGYGELLIVDDTFTVNRKWILEFCERYRQEGLELRWNCHARVNTLDEEVVRAMKAAHCTGMAFGIESGNPEMLRKIDKGITLEQAHNAVALCRKYRIDSLCSYIFGHPGDTWATVKDTMRVSLALDSDFANFCVMVPMPGSRIFEDLLKREYPGLKEWDRYLGHSRRVLDISLCDLSPDELHRVQAQAFWRFYFRPRYIWRRFLTIKSATALFTLLRGAYIVFLFQLQTRFKRRSNV